MGRQWDPESVNTSTSLDVGIYHVRSKGVEETVSKPNENSAGGKLMYVHMMEVIAPPEFAGLLQRDNWTIGTEDDKGAADPQTWKASIGAKSAKKALLAGKVTPTRDIDADFVRLANQEMLIRIKHKVNGEFINVNVADYFALGQRTVGVTANGASAVKAPIAAPKTKPVVVVAQPTATPGQAKAVAAPKAAEIQCPSCEWKGPRKDFPVHAQTHDEGDDDE